MKVDGVDRASAPAQKSQRQQQTFRELVKPAAKAAPPPAPKMSMPQPIRVAKGAVVTSAKLARVRQSIRSDAEQRTEARRDTGQSNEQRQDKRVMDLIVRELSESFGGAPLPSSPPATAPSAAAAPPDAANPHKRAEAVAQMIERIDVLVRSNRPTLSFTLNNSFAAQVEVEKTGPRQVSLRIQGWNGPPPPEEIALIRDALRERGLKLTSLSLA
ncbi:MAG TPA: hypothetical protein VH208_03840 [Myxococcaceae bacterium]|nr:hypothetical protein [Myxococcaceae bacterium]